MPQRQHPLGSARGYALHPGQIVSTNPAPWLGEARLELLSERLLKA